jgi:hypothetical protein
VIMDAVYLHKDGDSDWWKWKLWPYEY